MHFGIEYFLPNKKSSDCIIIGIFFPKILSYPARMLDDVSMGYISNMLRNSDMKGEIGETFLLYKVPNIFSGRVLLIGCGKKSDLNDVFYKKIIRISINKIIKMKVKKIISCLLDIYIKKINIYWKIRLWIELTSNMTYYFSMFKTTSIKSIPTLSALHLNIIKKKNCKIISTALHHGISLYKGITIAKDISNMPPNICNSAYLAELSKKLEKNYFNKVKTTIITSNSMKKLGMQAYLSVGNGSQNESIMSIIEYNSSDNLNNPTIVLIGKGLTFDSGGISIKSANSMHEMKYDMCGAAAVYGTLVAISTLKLSVNVIGVLAGCENMVDKNSFRPGDILKTMSGKTVEVMNTDAEGRLVLCDVLTYIQRFNPEIVIDVATLTGACITALGYCTSALISNSNSLSKDLINVSKKINDKIWRLPMFTEYQKELKSECADLNNIGTSNSAGTIIAACFLNQFVKKYKWAHLDIAGTAWIPKKQATGRPVSLLFQYLLNKFQIYSNNHS